MGWIESSPGQIVTGEVSADGTGGGRPGSYCPEDWEEDFDRSQMSTQVMVARSAPSNVPALRYIFAADTGPVPPAAGTFNLNGTQTAATKMYVSKQTDLGDDATIWLNYLHNGCSLSYKRLLTNESRGYQVTGTAVEHAGYFEVPIFWTQGTEVVPHGPQDLTLSITAEVPQVWHEDYGISHYGRMVFNRTDLISVNTDLFEKIATRVLAVRGSNSVPRLEAVTLNAATGKPGHNMSLMSLADPGKPSRYMCCMRVGGRQIFHRMCFATSTRHFISRDEWTLRISLDIAEWAALL